MSDIRSLVSEFIEVDDQIKARVEELKPVRNRQKNLREAIISWMANNLPSDEQCINLPDNGKLIVKKRKKYERYCQDLVGDRLQSLFASRGDSALGLEDIAQELVEKPLNVIEEVPSLTRVKARAPKKVSH